MARVTPLEGALYVAPEGYEAELQAELGDATKLAPRLYVAPGPPRRVAWPANVWFDPVRVDLAVDERAEDVTGTMGIEEPRDRLIEFPERVPASPSGAWERISPRVLVASARTSRPFWKGVPRFRGDRSGPPSRAYLKLWEALTLARRWPRSGEWCVDLGSSPGGWTWALERLGAHVLSVDKAPLDPRISKLRRVEFRRMSAFALDPGSVPRVDWVVSDVICYPARAVALVQRWLAAHPRARFVITLKLQGTTDMGALEPLRDIEQSELLHLHHNKHELTWMRV